tara:strand:+ start:635 stop:1618 length:984 start_codon:yes stop_codon:yes gene_type:complete
MTLRLLPWQSEYGTSLSYDMDDSENVLVSVDVAVEQKKWDAITVKNATRIPAQIIDGVRRAEVHVMQEDPVEGAIFGLFGSFAVGAVLCEEKAHVLEDTICVERVYLHSGKSFPSITISEGKSSLQFKSQRIPDSSNIITLLNSLQRRMLDAEILLASELSRDESKITFVDGPLRSLRSPGQRVIGYIKRIHQWYINDGQRNLLYGLAVNERTPLFHIPSNTEINNSQSGGRYSWFIRLRQLGSAYHPLGGIMRLETDASMPIEQARVLADESVQILPALSSIPGQDPRAPHNFVPVGRLEKVLTHRLGDQLWLNRKITSFVNRQIV